MSNRAVINALAVGDEDAIRLRLVDLCRAPMLVGWISVMLLKTATPPRPRSSCGLTTSIFGCDVGRVAQCKAIEMSYSVRAVKSASCTCIEALVARSCPMPRKLPFIEPERGEQIITQDPKST